MNAMPSKNESLLKKKRSVRSDLRFINNLRHIIKQFFKTLGLGSCCKNHRKSVSWSVKLASMNIHSVFNLEIKGLALGFF